MRKIFKDILRREEGAEVIEYAVALVILAAVFVWAGIQLARNGRERADMSIEAGRKVVACDPSMPLQGMGSDACK